SRPAGQAPAVGHLQPGRPSHDRCPAARLQLRAEGLPGRGARRDPPLRGTAPLRPGPGPLPGVPRPGGAGAAPSAAVRALQVRCRPFLPRLLRPADRPLPDPVPPPPAPLLRLVWADHAPRRVPRQRLPGGALVPRTADRPPAAP